MAPQSSNNPYTVNSTTMATTGPDVYTGNLSWDIPADSIGIADGRSLEEVLRGIEDRLNILRPDVPLHSEYAVLRATFEKYNEQLKEIREKIEVWDKLSN